MKGIVKDLILKPPNIKWSSQTIYQSLLGCIKLYVLTNELKWKYRSKNLCDIMVSIQKEDGGFDIGYDFNFGLLHKKGESTSPEMVGLLAIVEYGRVFGFSESTKASCDKAISWIKENTIFLSDKICYIPYAPHSTKKVMVYNGTSFVCGALGYYLGVCKDDDLTLRKIYLGMINFLNENLIGSQEFSGRYWPYYDQARTDLKYPKKGKIDYYHQMQQVEMHCYSQSVSPVEIQKELIYDACKYILDLYEKEGVVPYTNNTNDFGGAIHLWGFASIISGLQAAMNVLQINSDNFKKAIASSYDFICKFSWNGKWFYPIVSRDGKAIVKDYMVRSDAWIFNSLASMIKNSKDQTDRFLLLDKLELCYLKMELVNFSGPETHASNFRTSLIGKAIGIFKRFSI